MMEYTLSLALVDFLPVVFTAVGLFFIVRMVAYINGRQGRVAALGAGLTVAGGFFKAVWKLLMATSGGEMDIRLLDDALFILMAPGYTLLAFSVWQTVRAVRGQKTYHVWRAPVIFIGVMFALSAALYVSRPASPAWERILLSVMVLATVMTGVLLILFSFRQKLTLAGTLFIINLVGVFLLNGLARMPEQTIALQWIEESINAISWLAFMVAAVRVYGYTRENFGVDTAVAATPVTA
ncbi:MAG: hypothetical protein HND44_05375 [Chloroflexi bacterium]|nr:hypothetical protein [Ardenticatenaceae bacterium]MBL1127924.1 hypothetical protein [Chloroflexota bacterium]NOG33994.1 hypothetical protein [Chloroflexota bacterium]GIK55680.1 MAG: hypothetical protein BroJett015_13430 [Chloroflexota bacterium]